ncbi:hypothetical protein EV401DRAFT_2016667, partial [Pisolithus croceorrhizus]
MHVAIVSLQCSLSFLYCLFVAFLAYCRQSLSCMPTTRSQTPRPHRLVTASFGQGLCRPVIRVWFRLGVLGIYVV